MFLSCSLYFCLFVIVESQSGDRGGWSTLWPGQQLAAAIGADIIHVDGTGHTESAFVRTNAGLGLKPQGCFAFLALITHFQGHQCSSLCRFVE
jgi:hypothetical protein